jgi:hypothetical protein
MSENYERREIRSVSSSVLPLAGGEIILAAGLVSAILSTLSQGAREAYRIHSATMQSTPPNVIRPLSTLRRGHRAVRVGRGISSASEAVKVSTILTLANSGYLVENTPAIHQKLEVLRLAATAAEARIAQRNLIEELEGSHHRVFVKGLTLACAKASIKAGFSSVQTTETSSGVVRVVATDFLGRALVTEVSTRDTQESRIVTEVVGTSDGSCKKVMDIFDRALDEQGVKSSPASTASQKFCSL